MSRNKDNDSSLVMTIIEHLIELPDKSFKELQLTPSQEWYWCQMRTKSALMGMHWYSILQLKNDPLPDLVRAEALKESERVSITRYVNFLQRLWELVHAAEPYVRKIYESQSVPYPFDECGKYSSTHLYIEIIRDLINEQFGKTFEPYRVVSLKDLEKIARHAQHPERKPQKLRAAQMALKNFLPEAEKTWLLKFLSVCEANKRDLIVAERLECLLAAIKRLAADVEQNVKRKRRTSKAIKPCSHAWQNCELRIGDVHGGTYS